ncbi:MAG TPA: branched-chain amino acid ABC transporter ATP-binding protein/permease [Jiangellales bacterium]|nr:branched-chain amino acid ABC transporter ATP-binding protein/permease [Jiangellales bacterium]
MMRRGLIGFPIVLVALAALAVFQDSLGVSLFYITVLATLFFWVAQATSWNILSGYSGYFSFGQGAFVGVGVYTTAVLTSKHGWNFYLTLPVAAVLSTLLALGIGALAFRVGAFRGATFALLTLAVPFILASMARLSSRIDGGQGVSVPVPELPEPLGFQQFLYLVMLVIATVAVVAAYAIQYSRFGWALAAIRDNEDVAEALGVATFRWKMLAIAVTGAIGGVGGSAWALQFGFVQVEVVFGLAVPLFVIVMSVLGGRTYWLGPVLGAAVVVLVEDRLAGGGFESWRPIIFGALLALMVIFAPDGLWAQLKARPLLTGITGAVALLVLFVAEIGDVLDRIVLAMLATVVAAFWPRRLLPARLRPAAAALPAMPAAAAPTSEAAAPEPHDEETGSPVNGLAVSTAGADAPVVIECRRLARHYGGVRALDGLDLQIRQGELVGLIGPNGSGKTTLVNLLSGAVRPTRGSIHVDGRDVTRLAPHAINHAGVARTYQIPRPFESMTLHDNVAMAIMFGRKPHSLAQARSRATKYLEFVGLERYGAARPADINLHQRQLLEMARALATDPKVLFLDESLAGLNPAEIDNAVEVVRRIHTSGVTIVIVEHLLRVVNQLAERVVVLNRGRLLADGDTQTVMRDPAVVDVYLGKSGRTAPANDIGSQHA